NLRTRGLAGEHHPARSRMGGPPGSRVGQPCRSSLARVRQRRHRPGGLSRVRRGLRCELRRSRREVPGPDRIDLLAAVRMSDFRTKDFPEHGLHLIGPSNPSFARLAELIKSSADSVTDVPPVFLQNTSKHAVVGYRITWECVDKAGVADVRHVSNIIS